MNVCLEAAELLRRRRGLHGPLPSSREFSSPSTGSWARTPPGVISHLRVILSILILAPAPPPGPALTREAQDCTASLLPLRAQHSPLTDRRDPLAFYRFWSWW